MKRPIIPMSAEACVGKAALWYDEQFPGWYQQVDLDLLNLKRAETCVAGQVIPATDEEDGYGRLDDGALDAPPEVHEACLSTVPSSAPYEVDVASVEPRYVESLHEAWTAEVLRRRAWDAQ